MTQSTPSISATTDTAELTELFIDGTWRPGATGQVLDVFDPATDARIGQVACATSTDLDDALVSAEAGFAIWQDVAATERAQLLHRTAFLLRERLEAIANTLTREQGKPLAQARAETNAVADTIDWFAGEAQRTYGQVIPSRDRAVLQFTMRAPVGPVAAFTPWNFPLLQMVRKLAPALAAGCSIIIKAPEETPAAPAALVRCLADAGLPAGVVNLVFGDPAMISGYLIPHPTIRKLSFTGSTQVGKQLAALAGEHMKRTTMELGGHAPVMIFDDADIEAALTTMAAHKFRNAGQVCISPTRFLVQSGVAEQFSEAFVKATSEIQVGNGLDENTDMGPLANARRVGALEELVSDAVSRGAKLAIGGRRIGNVGNFFEPTVLQDVPVEARIMREEPFGPIAIINQVTGVEQALAEANRLPIGLASYAFTGSQETAQKLRNGIRAGMLAINHVGFGLPELPFEGIGESGYGSEGGSDAILSYLENKLVTQKT